MTAEGTYHPDSSAVQAHVGIMQGVIQRMAANSGACKTWCVTLVAAILVVVATKQKPQYGWLALIPILLFVGLDTYYLALERSFRGSYNAFVTKLHEGKIVGVDLYTVRPAGSAAGTWLRCLLSWSIWPFHVTLAVTILLAKAVVL